MIAEYPLISIIVPVYNVEKYLIECLNSIRKQTYQNIEIIVVNDGSTDKSAFICDEYAKKDVRFKVYHTNNNGLSSARNFGLKKARGDYIGFVDSDDICEEHMFQMLIEAAVNSEADIVFGAKRNLFKDKICNARLSPYPNQLISKENFLEAVLSQGVWRRSACAGGYVTLKLFSRKCISGLSFISTKICIEDEFFCVSASLNAKKIFSLSSEIYLYRQRASSAVRNKRISMLSYIGRIKINDIIENYHCYGSARFSLKERLFKEIFNNFSYFVHYMNRDDFKEIKKFVGYNKANIKRGSIRKKIKILLMQSWFPLVKSLSLILKDPEAKANKKNNGELFQ